MTRRGRLVRTVRAGPPWATPLAALLVLGTVAAAVGTTVDGGFAASVRNSTSNSATGTLFLRATQGASTLCTATPAGSAIPATTDFPCTGSTLPASVPSAGTGTQSTTLTNGGTVTPAAATHTATSCGPVQLANQTTATNPMLVRGGVTYAQGGPFTGSAALGVDGSTGFAGSAVSGTAPAAPMTMAIWFRSTSTTGGTMLGFGNSPTYLSETQADRMLWMTDAGKVGFGVGIGQVLGVIGDSITTTSPNSYNDGNWHLAVGVLATATILGIGSGTVTLYVDGTQVGTANKALVLGTPTVYTGYWHAGWSPVNPNSWTTGSSAYFNGRLANAAIFPSALTAANATTLAGTASQTAWAGSLTTLGANQSWGLGDNGQTTYAGTVPGLSASPCTMVAVTVGGSGFCAYPNAPSTSCAAPTSTATLATMVTAGAQSFPVSTPSTPVSLTTTVARATTYDATYANRLHLLVPVVVAESRGGFLNRLTWSGNDLVI